MTASGTLRDRVVFQRRRAVEDGAGNTVGAWETLFDRPAEITLLRGGEDVMGARLAGTQPALVRVRFDRQTAAIDPSWRLYDARVPLGAGGVPPGAALFNIKSAADIERRRVWITLVCEAGVPT